ncbi:putative ABC transporter G family member 42 [Cocos nucifera]|uniref:Putative ABC transporter G family member 42 n=1 Tax=Cocos nucifera TaxID=13894 RepID=A0A8K0N704_COCNU|nr:putative ABC transporter G family member 42 [Cocos nucifera]
MEIAMVISLLQPPLETYELFDDIIILCEGQIAYQGPRENVLEFFETMGFKCPERKNIADFLQEVTSEMDQAQYWVGNQRKYQYVPVQKFADSFNSFHVSRLPDKEFNKAYGQTDNDQMLGLEERYKISKRKLFKACFSREMLLMKRNSPVHIFMAIQILLLAFVTMTVFIRTEMNHHSVADGNRYMGAIFAGVVIIKFNGMTELSIMIRRLPIFYKQRAQLYLPGWALLSSITVLSLPISFLETGLWTCFTYYVIGFAPSAIRFLQQFLAFFCVHQMSMGLFRFIAVVGRTQLMANTLGSATLVAVYILGGFVISRDNIHPWLIWGYWLSPMTYGQNAVAINEFLDKRWSRKVDNGANNTYTIGKAILKSRGMLAEWHWFWYCVGVLLGFALLFNMLSILALEYLKGAGKTTLLDVLAGRKTAGHIEGSISISGYPKRQKTFARISGYCEQTDNHSPFLTVYESLRYSAWLRLPSNVDAHARSLFVNEVMDLVELTPLQNAMVGLPGTNGLAAEQRKRLTIAVELVSSPSIIFMDEPTTGLDARSAAIIMRTVRKTVDTGRTIVCTIHQPSIDIFDAFDELLLMKKGGQLIYGGPLGSLSRNMIRYFEAIPGVPKIRDGQNPAAWMLDATSPAMESKLGIDFGTIFRNSSSYTENMQLVDELSKAQSNSGDLHFPSKYAKSFMSQCIACMWKQHRSYWKNPEHNIVRFIITISTALLFGTVFLGIGSNMYALKYA